MDNKKIFSTDFIMALEEYKKMMMLMPGFYLWNVFKTSIVEIIIILIVSVMYKLNITTTVIISAIVTCFVMILYRIKIAWLIRKYYNYYKKRGMLEDKVNITFFDNYLIKKSNNFEMKLNYEQTKKIIETESNFYIYFNNVIVAINKENCKEKDERFLRNINTNNYYYKKTKAKKNIYQANVKDNTFLLNLLLYTTIFSFFGAILTIRKVAEDIPSSLITEKMWLFWLWLPLPILSIIVGYRSINKNKKAKNNVICGAIISILLIVFGNFCVVMPVGRISYDKIKAYEDILMVDIPKDGEYIQRRYETYFDLDKKNVLVTEALLKDSLELEEFEQNIVKGQNWINFKKISSDLEQWIPYQMIHRECKKCYITIYNENTKEYNAVTEIKKNYKMCVALYDMDNKLMEINTYEFK